MWAKKGSAPLSRLAQLDGGAFIGLPDGRTAQTHLTEAAADVTVTVPGDYASLQAAVDAVRYWRVAPGKVVDIVIQTGHALESGVLVTHGDYSHVRISSIDAQVSLALTFPAASIIEGQAARMPTLNCLIDANNKGIHGYYAESGSTGVVLAGAGVRRAAQHGLYANSGSVVVAGGSVFTEASQSVAAYSGILSWGSIVDAFGADVSNSLYYGAQAAAAGLLYFRDGVAAGCARHNVRATNGAVINARNANAQNGGVSGLRCFDGSIAHAVDINVAGSATGIWCENTSTVNAEAATGSNTTGSFVYCNDGSTVNVAGATATLAVGANIRADNGSRVMIGGATLSTTGASIITADNGSDVIGAAPNLSHAGASIGIDADTGSRVIVPGATLNVPSARAISAFNGSEVNIVNGVVTHLVGDAVNMSSGSLCRVNGSNILAADVAGMLFNTLYGRGICWG